MEPNKFENQIKDKLEGRAIQPSAKSWDRLDAMLSVEEKPKKKSFLWYYVAASLFFVFGVSYWFVNQNSNEVIPQNTIVTTEGKDSKESFEEQNSIENKVETNDILIEDFQINKNSAIVQNQEPKNVNYDKKIKVENLKEETFIQNQIIEEKEAIVENNKPKTKNNKPIYVSPEKLLASVENSQENISITHSKKTNNSIKVNPNSLLSSVENEIKEEYRETTFDKLKRKFNETKSAVANRNYE
ncbi:hypothetical protein [Flavobacterium haoranii]|uniref:Uncharacterized protein n=1 Tax=Flavobacterium haoranii TaxID=683124 RepID=A0A1M6D6M6_9FLAO|nr:hypothetical protein [Flavobacterium haoranii]SHI68804.1 hypothetical protein SAMN05444337_0558 [Flavobacterium haoranii]